MTLRAIAQMTLLLATLLSVAGCVGFVAFPVPLN
jgi:hypothetical protein